MAERGCSSLALVAKRQWRPPTGQGAIDTPNIQ